MKKQQLEKGIELKKQIEELEEMVEYIRDCKGGKFMIRKPKYLFNYRTWFNKEKTFRLNERLAFRMLLEVDRELDDLKSQFEYL